MFARRYKSYAWALLVGGVLGCSRPRWPATLNPTNSARAAAAERPTRMTSLPRRRFEGGHWWGRESTSGDAAAGSARLRARTAATNALVSAAGSASYSAATRRANASRSEEHTSELQSRSDLVCRLLLE